MSIHRSFLATLAASLGVAAAVAPAAEAPWASTSYIIRAGGSLVDPKNGVLTSPTNQKLSIDDATDLSIEFTSMLNQNWGIEVYAAPSLDHDTSWSNPAGATSGLGSVRMLLETVTLQHHFKPLSRVRPYVGAGIGYAKFAGAKSGTMSFDDSFGPAVVAGVDFGITNHLFFNMNARWVDVDSDTKFNGAAIGTAAVDPIVYSINLGWRFGKTAAPVMPVVAAAAAAPVVMPKAAPPPPPVAPPPPPADSDGDGVIDPNDMCPNTPRGTRVGAQGCACDLTFKLNFAFDSATLTDADKTQLDALADELKRLNWMSGVIEGHTDSRGADAYNQKLSERRATAVETYLASRGVDPERFVPQGFGKKQPVADNATAEGRAENRRVVLRRLDCDKPK
jgi:outer membrane protein OmpA-like peptidoglycan-associated protein/opacity protein-like surface antigen